MKKLNVELTGGVMGDHQKVFLRVEKEEARLKKIVFCKCGALMVSYCEDETVCPIYDSISPFGSLSEEEFEAEARKHTAIPDGDLGDLAVYNFIQELNKYTMKKYKSKSVQADIELDEERRKNGICNIPKPKYWIGDIVIAKGETLMPDGDAVGQYNGRVVIEEATVSQVFYENGRWYYSVAGHNLSGCNGVDILYKKE